MAVYNEEKQEVTIFAVNRTLDQTIEFEADLRGFEGYTVKEYSALEGDDMKATNSAAEEKVSPITRTDYNMDGGIFTTAMKPASWNVIRFGK